MGKSKQKQEINESNCNCECNCSENDCDCGCNELEEKVKKLEEALLRNQAELMNFKRRKEEETSRMLKYASEDIFSEFLPILDNFERAIKMDDEDLDDEVSKFLEGFKMVYAQTKKLLDKYDVHEIECLNTPFDPSYHQAVLTDKSDEYESGIILEVLQKGYMYKDKVIRPSMVKVNE